MAKAHYLAALAVFLFALMIGEQAHADACVDAAKRQNAQVRKSNSWYAAVKKKALGSSDIVVDTTNTEHCAKGLPIFIARIPMLEEVDRLDRAMARVCPPSRVDYVAGKGAQRYVAAAESLTIVKETIDKCQKMLALAASAAPSSQTANTSNVSGASAPPKAAVSARRRPWSGRKEDCEDAGRLERATASWYDVCVLTANAKPRTGEYQPPISPQNLTAQALTQCKDASGVTKQQCVFDAKLKILLADDANVRAECSAKTGQGRIACVDAVFLYGPGASQGTWADHENHRRRIMALPDYVIEKDMTMSRAPDGPHDNRCAPGYGMKPEPKAFGAWSCQPLGVIFIAPDRPAPGHDATKAAQAFEERIRDVAIRAVAAAMKTHGSPLSAADRDMCSAQAFAAVLSAMKGGAPEVSDKCVAVTAAARGELAYYAAAHVDTASDPGVEELLSAFGAAGSLGAAPVAADCGPAETHWKSAEQIKSLMVYRDHLARFPHCSFAGLAAARIEQFSKP